MAFVGGFEFVDETGEELGACGVAGGGVVVHQITAAAAKDFAHGRGREVGDFGVVVAGFKKREYFLGGAEGALFERVDKQRGVFEVAADHEVAGEADGLEVDAEALGDEQVNDAQRKRDAFAAFEDDGEETVERVGVVLGVAAKTVFVEEHAIHDAAFLAHGEGLGDEFAAAGGEVVEALATQADVDVGKHGAGEEEGAGFELVVERADEVAEFGDGVGELEFFEVAARVGGEEASAVAGDVFEEEAGGFALGGEVSEEGFADGGAGVVEQRQNRFVGEGCGGVVHGIKTARIGAGGKRETGEPTVSETR